MKIFSNKKMLFKLIVALCIFLALIGSGNNYKVYAEDEGGNFLYKTTKGAVQTGGKLLAPIVDLVLVLGDAVIDILQQAIMGTESSISIDTTAKVIIGILSVLFALVVAVGIILLLGPLAAALPILSSVAVGAVGIASITVGGIVGAAAYRGMSGKFLPDITILPTYSISPEEIFKGEILLFDVNIFNPRELYVKVSKDGTEVTKTAEDWNSQQDKNGYEVKYYYYYKDRNPNNNAENNIIVTSANNSADELKKVVAKWYYTIRNIALIGLMIVLAYVGIRMMISTTAAEKSKYKQMLGDWVIAMCLIFVMQFIMVLANNVTESITLLFSSVSDANQHVTVISEADKELINAVKEIGLGDTVQGENIIWPSNLMGKSRLLAQQQDGTPEYIGYGLCYMILVIFTVIFTITYAKRLLYIVFFSIIAPLVALTYPIDKINDGKAQAFNLWLKEYIFNLLIQPFHLLLYTVLISTAFDLAGTNIIYTLVAMGFMIPAEKFLRKMFGFDKASTPGFLEGAAGAAFAMHGLHSLEKIAGRGPGSKDKSNGTSQDSNKIDFMDRGADSKNKISNLLESISNPQLAQQQKQQQEEQQEEHQQRYKDQSDKQTQQKIEQQQEKLQQTEQSQQEKLQQTEQFQQEELQQVEEREQEELHQIAEPQQEEIQQPNSPKIQHWSQMPKKYMGARYRNLKRAYANQFSRENIVENIGKTAKGVIKTGASVAIGAGGAMIGSAAGIASGSLDSVGKNTIAGGYSGSAIGTGMANYGINKIERGIAENKRTHEEALKEMYGENYSNYIKQRKDDMFKLDSTKREMYAREFSNQLDKFKGKERKEKLNEIMDAAIEYRKYGVTDDGTIIKAMKIDKGNPLNVTEQDKKERIAAAKLAGVSKSSKDLETTIKRFKQTPGISKDQVERMENRIRRMNDIN